jgi:small subunit ribosomal protein S8
MSLNKTLCDLSARLRNGQNSRKLEIYLKRSKVCLNVLNILKEQGYIRGYIVEAEKIRVLLKYMSDKPVITDVNITPYKLYSTYISVNTLKNLTRKLKKTNKGLGLFILSTPKGILSDYQCILKNTGGQLLLKIV